MPQQPDNVERVELSRSTEPITDDPRTLEELQNAGLLEREAEAPPEWAEPVKDLAEGQKALQDNLAKLTEAIQAMAEHRPVDRERIIEREREPEPEPEVPSWRGKVKPEQADLLREAIRAEVLPLLEEFKAQDLAPTLGYLVQGHENLLEDHLKGKYPDDTFGFESLEDKAQQYRKAYNYQITLEDAFQKVAFHEMNQALSRANAERLSKATEDKRNLASDAPEHVGEGVRASAEDDVLTAEERHLSKIFFEGNDPRTGKPRSQKEMEAMWVEHRKGAKRDMMSD